MLLNNCNYGNRQVIFEPISAQEIHDLGARVGRGVLLLQHRQVEVQSIQEALEGGGVLQSQGHPGQEENTGGDGVVSTVIDFICYY